MADPVTWAVIGSIVSGGTDFSIGAGKAFSEHKEADKKARYAEADATLQRDLMEFNRRMALKEADTVESEGNENARRMRIQAEQARSQRIAALGKSGVAMSSGSPLAALAYAAGEEEKAIQDKRYATAREAQQYLNKAADYAYVVNAANLNIRSARSSRPTTTSLLLNIGGAALGTASRADKHGKNGEALASLFA